MSTPWEGNTTGVKNNREEAIPVCKNDQMLKPLEEGIWEWIFLGIQLLGRSVPPVHILTEWIGIGKEYMTIPVSK